MVFTNQGMCTIVVLIIVAIKLTCCAHTIASGHTNARYTGASLDRPHQKSQGADAVRAILPHQMRNTSGNVSYTPPSAGNRQCYTNSNGE